MLLKEDQQAPAADENDYDVLEREHAANAVA